MSSQMPPDGPQIPPAAPPSTPSETAAPPPAPGTPPASLGTAPPSGPRAGFWKRFVALLVDVILVGIVQTIINLIFGVDGFGLTYGYMPGAAETSAGASLVNLAVQVGYYTYLEGSASGQTVGKRLLNIRVIDFGTGSSIGYPRAALRWLSRILSGIPCGLGYFWMLWDGEKQTWHDKLTNSVVVPTDAYPVDKWPG